MSAHRSRSVSAVFVSQRNRLMQSCAAAVIAAAVACPTAASAQALGAFRGSISSSSGSVSRSPITNTTETITIDSSTATINWSPTDVNGTGNIDFLPAGNVATFVNGANTADYTVLNRIIPVNTSRAIELNGTVVSQIQNGQATGGRVWFYSPGGVVVGSSAVFNVGALLLTANDPTGLQMSSNSPFFSGTFTAGTNSASRVVVNAGAQINATPENSYVALIAPRVEQRGTINVNGSAALVAAESTTMTFSQGLFDISVGIGTSDPFNGIYHTGTTGGPASTGAADAQKIYMVAVPKNQAITMFLSGNVGFASAVSASVENGAIVLSSGWSIGDGPEGVSGSSAPGTDASIHIDGGQFTSDVYALTNGRIDAYSNNAALNFSGDVSLHSYASATSGDVNLWTYVNPLTIGGSLYVETSGATYTSAIYLDSYAGGTVNIAGNTTLITGPAMDGSVGWVNISSGTDGAITIGGTTQLYAMAGAASPNPDLPSADNYGGEVYIDAYDGGTITFANLNANVSANGQDNVGNVDGLAGSGSGGDFEIYASGGGTVTVNGNLTVNADGSGGHMYDGASAGGDGNGGWIDISTYDGTISVTGNVTLSANGLGGDYLGEGVPAVATGGEGFGGDILISTDGPGSLTVGGSTDLIARGIGGDGQSGGNGYGGWAGVEAFDGNLTLHATNVYAGADGGNASSGFGGTGGVGDGGSAFLQSYAYEGDVEVGPTSAVLTAGAVGLHAIGTGGVGGAGNGDNIAAGSGGEGWGGSTYMDADGTVTLGNVLMISNGVGGAGGAGGSGPGGSGGAGYGGWTDLTVEGSFTAQYFENFARAQGGAGGTGSVRGVGGYAEGGSASLYVEEGGTANIATTAIVNSTAFGGEGAIGGEAWGGYSDVYVYGTLTGAGLQVTAQGFGGLGVAGAGGEATGGASYLDIYSGTLDFSDYVALANSAVGGDGTTVGGAATGGWSEIYMTDSTADFGGEGSQTANATGGAGDIKGDAWGGDVSFYANNSTVTTGYLTLTAGGDVGGYADFDIYNSNVSAGALSIVADGAQQGGWASMAVASGDIGEPSNLTADSLTMSATGESAAGLVYLEVGSASSADVGAAVLTATGGETFEGGVIISVGDYAVIDDAVDTAAVGDAVLTADSMTVNSSGLIELLGSSGEGIDVFGTFSATGEQLLMIHDGSISTLSANQIDISANYVQADWTMDAVNVDISSDTDLSVVDIFATQSVSLTAGGGAYLHGLVSAPNIEVTSADIEIYGQLGEHGVTDLLTLNAVSSGSPIIIGGFSDFAAAEAPDGYQYRLSAEGEIEADQIVLNAVGWDDGPDPDVILESIEIDGSNAEDGGASYIGLFTDGSVFVNGQVVVYDADISDTLEIEAGQTIRVNTSTGGLIAMIDGNERPSGHLEMEARHIWVGNSTLLDNLAENPNFEGRDNQLENNPGDENLDGSLIAGGMELSVRNTLFVQNSGTADDFAGITVGDGGLEIDADGEQPAAVFAYGRRYDEDGGATGEDFAGEIEFGDEDGFTEQSAFNNCLLSGECGDGGGGEDPGGPEEPPFEPKVSGPEAILGPVGLMESPAEEVGAFAEADEQSEQSEEDEEGEGSGSRDVSLGLISTGALTLDQLIEEPVTSGGDTVQWGDTGGQEQ